MLFCFFSGFAAPFSDPDALAVFDDLADLEDLDDFSSFAALLDPATDAAAADLAEEEERDAVVVLRDAEDELRDADVDDLDAAVP